MLTSSNPSSPKPRRSAASVISRSRPHCAGKHERIVHAVLLAPEAAPAAAAPTAAPTDMIKST